MTPATIISQTACAYGLAPSALASRSQAHRIAEARAIAAYLAYEHTEASYRELAAELCRERSCVRRIIDRVDLAIRRNLPLARRVTELERGLSLAVAGGGPAADDGVGAGVAGGPVARRQAL